MNQEDNPYQSPLSADDGPPPLNAALPACVASCTAFVAGFMVFAGMAVVGVVFLLDGTLVWRTTQFAVLGTCLFLSLGTAVLVGRYVYRQRVRTHERLLRLHQERDRLAAEIERQKADAGSAG